MVGIQAVIEKRDNLQMNKIGYLVSELAAPSHTFVRREIAALRKQGGQIQAYSIHGSREDPDYTSILGQPVLGYVGALLVVLFRNPMRLAKTFALSLRHRPPGLRSLIWSQFHLLEAIYLARLLEKDGCRHLHNHFANSGATVGLLASKLAGISWSLTLHGISETDFPAGSTLGTKIEQAVFVACASRFMMAQGMRVVDRRHWQKFGIVRCPLDRSTLPEQRTKSAPRKLRLICVGRLSAEKGYFGLFEALRALPRETPDFTLTIVGDGPMGDELKHAAIEQDLGDKVQFRGALSEADTLEEIATSDVLILPSLMEGLPVVLLESRALGKPVIATAIAGIPEFVQDGKTGLLFEPANWAQLSKRIFAILNDEELRNALTEKAASSFPQEFEMETVAETLASRFDAILAGNYSS